MEFASTHKESIIVGVIVFVFMLLIMIMVGIGSSKGEFLASGPVTRTPWKNKSEHMKLPWANKSEHLFSGDLTPAQQALYSRLSKSDPVNSQFIKAEYMNNKTENPNLVDKLMYA